MPSLRSIAIYLTLSFLLFSGSLPAGLMTADAEADQVAPKAVFIKQNHDFGEVFEGTEIKHDFVVENKGDAPLVIKNIRPD